MNIDTVKIKQCGKDIVELTKELNEIIDDLYTKLINIINKLNEKITNLQNFYQNNKTFA